jgi:hypothetical protein
LGGTKKLANGCRDGLAINKVVGLQVVGLRLSKSFFDCSLNPNQARAKLVLSKLADTTHTAVSKVVNVVDLPSAITQLNEQLNSVKNVLMRKNWRAENIIATQPAIEFHSTHTGEIVRVFAEEQSVK